MASLLVKTKPPGFFGGQEAENNCTNCTIYWLFNRPPDRGQEFVYRRNKNGMIRHKYIPTCAIGILRPCRGNPPRYKDYMNFHELCKVKKAILINIALQTKALSILF